MFTTAHDAVQFALAGNATLTLKSKVSGKHFTYKIRQAKNRETGELEQTWFVGLLTGPDNTEDYQYLGIINGENRFRLTAKSRAGEDAPSVKAFSWFWSRACYGELSEQMDVMHTGLCGRCGRTLTVPSSIESGIGPECAKYVGG